MIKFILNTQDIKADMPPGILLLDFVRYHKHLTGTKIGCREGDCGACTVLVGRLKDDEVTYRSYTSCLTPLGNIHGKHVVTIEGVNMADLNAVQQAMTDCSATQCGFCTPGFVVSLAGFCLSKKEATPQNAIASIDGNICRCTGYKSIERAAALVAEMLQEKGEEDPLEFVSRKKILPGYFGGIKQRLKILSLQLDGEISTENLKASIVGGGTDLYVQKHEEMKYRNIHFTQGNTNSNEIVKVGSRCIFGPSVTVTDLHESSLFRQYFSSFGEHVKLISSTPVRNMATIAGNFINASPIGDFTIFFLALNATVVLSNGESARELPLRKLYKTYKVLDKNAYENVERIWFELPDKSAFFNFEKVSKRTNLDIASVNTAIHIKADGNGIIEASLSAGGVAPIPLFLERTSRFLEGKILNEELIMDATEIAQTEISPISDARGTADYKRLLLSQLIKAHFITLFPALNVAAVLGMQDY